MDLRQSLSRKFRLLAPTMSERARRLWAGAEADAIGYGGVKLVSDATGLGLNTVRRGRDQIRAGASMVGVVRDRRKGAGPKRLELSNPALVPALEALVSPETRGCPESPLRWTSKSTQTLAEELTAQGQPVSATKVASLLASAGYSLQATAKVKEGSRHPDRDSQFRFIAQRTSEFIAGGVPVISVDAKKKENVGEFANRGKEWQRKKTPVQVMTYEFFGEREARAIPYGVHSISRWWELMGSRRYPGARELFITADGGGSNGRKVRLWKSQLQAMADRFKLSIHVSHYPPGTSKWNRIEHRLFSFISLNWRGRPLVTYETIISLIAATTTGKGLTVTAELDRAKYPVGITVARDELRTLHIEPHSFHGEWNYTLKPRTAEQVAMALAKPDERQPFTQRARRERWRALMEQQRLSGLSERSFCRKRGVSYAGFKHARRTLIGLIRTSSSQRQ
jgi:hypothetical protein